jgi:tRNA (guanine37-N1)-methyltransferase
MRFDILTLFPDLFSPFLHAGVLGRAVEKGLLDVRLTNIRSFARGSHKVTDDRPYGGGNGMIMKPGPIVRALESIDRVDGSSLVVLLTPQGQTFEQSMAWELARADQLVLICCRYEGVDERVRSDQIDMEVSIGDYILSGGELGALVILDAVSRLVPGVLGGERSNLEDSFQDGLLEYPQYTRPDVYQNWRVPSVLLSGNHGQIAEWRRRQAILRTAKRRPDLLEKGNLCDEERKWILENLLDPK